MSTTDIRAECDRLHRALLAAIDACPCRWPDECRRCRPRLDVAAEYDCADDEPSEALAERLCEVLGIDDPADIDEWLIEWESLLVRIDASQLSRAEYLDLLGDIRASVENAIEAARRGEP